jgi:hypothetical protein
MSRPSFQPTEEQRKLVKSLAAVGMRQDQICTVLGLKSPKTLRKYFRQPLSSGLAEAIATVTRTAYEMAISGRHTAITMFWLKSQTKWLEPEEDGERTPVKYIWEGLGSLHSREARTSSAPGLRAEGSHGQS